MSVEKKDKEILKVFHEQYYNPRLLPQIAKYVLHLNNTPSLANFCTTLKLYDNHQIMRQTAFIKNNLNIDPSNQKIQKQLFQIFKARYDDLGLLIKQTEKQQKSNIILYMLIDKWVQKFGYSFSSEQLSNSSQITFHTSKKNTQQSQNNNSHSKKFTLNKTEAADTDNKYYLATTHRKQLYHKMRTIKSFYINLSKNMKKKHQRVNTNTIAEKEQLLNENMNTNINGNYLKKKQSETRQRISVSQQTKRRENSFRRNTKYSLKKNSLVADNNANNHQNSDKIKTNQKYRKYSNRNNQTKDKGQNIKKTRFVDTQANNNANKLQQQKCSEQVKTKKSVYTSKSIKMLLQQKNIDLENLQMKSLVIVLQNANQELHKMLSKHTVSLKCIEQTQFTQQFKKYIQNIIIQRMSEKNKEQMEGETQFKSFRSQIFFNKNYGRKLSGSRKTVTSNLFNSSHQKKQPNPKQTQIIRQSEKEFIEDNLSSFQQKIIQKIIKNIKPRISSNCNHKVIEKTVSCNNIKIVELQRKAKVRNDIIRRKGIVRKNVKTKTQFYDDDVSERGKLKLKNKNKNDKLDFRVDIQERYKIINSFVQFKKEIPPAFITSRSKKNNYQFYESDTDFSEDFQKLNNYKFNCQYQNVGRQMENLTKKVFTEETERLKAMRKIVDKFSPLNQKNI